MPTATMQGTDGLFYEVDLDAINKVADLQKAVLELQDALCTLVTGNTISSLLTTKEAISTSLNESEALVTAQEASISAQTGAASQEDSSGGDDTGTINIVQDTASEEEGD